LVVFQRENVTRVLQVQSVIARSPRRARERDRERAAGGRAHRVQLEPGDV